MNLSYLIPCDSPTEFDFGWRQLDAIAGSMVDHNPNSKEIWQYMGTVVMTDCDGSPVVIVHQYRHRDRPAGLEPLRVHGLTDGLVTWYDLNTGERHRELIAGTRRSCSGRCYVHLVASDEFHSRHNLDIPRDYLPGAPWYASATEYDPATVIDATA